MLINVLKIKVEAARKRHTIINIYYFIHGNCYNRCVRYESCSTNRRCKSRNKNVFNAMINSAPDDNTKVVTIQVDFITNGHSPLNA